MESYGRIAFAAFFGAWVLSAATVRAQPQGGAPTGELRDRITRISADLFSPAPRLDDDIRALKQILAVDPSVAQAHMLLGIAYRALGSQDMMGEAVAELRQALALSPGYVPARLYLAYVYLDIGRPQRAREELEAALRQAPGNPQLQALLGEAERQLKNPQRAADLTRQALQADPSSAEARYYLGLALFDLGKRAEAIAELEQVVASGQAAADAYLSLGALYVEAGRSDDAIQALTRGVQLDPKRADLRIQLARVYRTKGQLDRAEEQLRLVRPARRSSREGAPAPLAPTEFRQQQLEFDLTMEQGALDLERGRLAPAIAAFKKALTMDPGHGPANHYLAQIYLHQGSYAAAARYADAAEKAGAPLTAEERKQIQAGVRGGKRD